MPRYTEARLRELYQRFLEEKERRLGVARQFRREGALHKAEQFREEAEQGSRGAGQILHGLGLNLGVDTQESLGRILGWAGKKTGSKTLQDAGTYWGDAAVEDEKTYRDIFRSPQGATGHLAFMGGYAVPEIAKFITISRLTGGGVGKAAQLLKRARVPGAAVLAGATQYAKGPGLTRSQRMGNIVRDIGYAVPYNWWESGSPTRSVAGNLGQLNEALPDEARSELEAYSKWGLPLGAVASGGLRLMDRLDDTRMGRFVAEEALDVLGQGVVEGGLAAMRTAGRGGSRLLGKQPDLTNLTAPPPATPPGPRPPADPRLERLMGRGPRFRIDPAEPGSAGPRSAQPPTARPGYEPDEGLDAPGLEDWGFRIDTDPVQGPSPAPRGYGAPRVAEDVPYDINTTDRLLPPGHTRLGGDLGPDEALRRARAQTHAQQASRGTLEAGPGGRAQYDEPIGPGGPGLDTSPGSQFGVALRKLLSGELDSAAEKEAVAAAKASLDAMRQEQEELARRAARLSRQGVDQYGRSIGPEPGPAPIEVVSPRTQKRMPGEVVDRQTQRALPGADQAGGPRIRGGVPERLPAVDEAGQYRLDIGAALPELTGALGRAAVGGTAGGILAPEGYEGAGMALGAGLGALAPRIARGIKEVDQAAIRDADEAYKMERWVPPVLEGPQGPPRPPSTPGQGVSPGQVAMAATGPAAAATALAADEEDGVLAAGAMPLLMGRFRGAPEAAKLLLKNLDQLRKAVPDGRRLLPAWRTPEGMIMVGPTHPTITNWAWQRGIRFKQEELADGFLDLETGNFLSRGEAGNLAGETGERLPNAPRGELRSEYTDLGAYKDVHPDEMPLGVADIGAKKSFVVAHENVSRSERFGTTRALAPGGERALNTAMEDIHSESVSGDVYVDMAAKLMGVDPAVVRASRVDGEGLRGGARNPNTLIKIEVDEDSGVDVRALAELVASMRGYPHGQDAVFGMNGRLASGLTFGDMDAAVGGGVHGGLVIEVADHNSVADALLNAGIDATVDIGNRVVHVVNFADEPSEAFTKRVMAALGDNEDAVGVYPDLYDSFFIERKNIHARITSSGQTQSATQRAWASMDALVREQLIPGYQRVAAQLGLDPDAVARDVESFGNLALSARTVAGAIADRNAGQAVAERIVRDNPVTGKRSTDAALDRIRKSSPYKKRPLLDPEAGKKGNRALAPKRLTRAAREGAKHVLEALNTTKRARAEMLQWYRAETDRAMNIVAMQVPELYDHTFRKLFHLVSGAASIGSSPMKELALATEVTREFLETGTVTRANVDASLKLGNLTGRSQEAVLGRIDKVLKKLETMGGLSREEAILRLDEITKSIVTETKAGQKAGLPTVDDLVRDPTRPVSAYASPLQRGATGKTELVGASSLLAQKTGPYSISKGREGVRSESVIDRHIARWYGWIMGHTNRIHGKLVGSPDEIGVDAREVQQAIELISNRLKDQGHNIDPDQVQAALWYYWRYNVARNGGPITPELGTLKHAAMDYVMGPGAWGAMLAGPATLAAAASQGEDLQDSDLLKAGGLFGLSMLVAPGGVRPALKSALKASKEYGAGVKMAKGVYDDWVDHHAALPEFEKMLKGSHGVLSQTVSTLRGFRGAGQVRISEQLAPLFERASKIPARFTNNGLVQRALGVISNTGKAQGAVDEVAVLAWARRVIELDEHGKPRIPTDDAGNDLFTMAEIKSIRDALEADEDILGVADGLNEYYAQLLADRRAAGILNQAEYDKYVNAGEFYIPMSRDFDERATTGQQGGGLGLTGTGDRRLREGKIISTDVATHNPWDAGVIHGLKTDRQILAQRVRTAFGDLVKSDPEGAKLLGVEEVTGKPKGAGVDAVTFRIDGEDRKFVIRDERLYKAMISQPEANTELAAVILRGSKNFQRAMITTTPFFAIANSMRDIAFSAVQGTAHTGKHNVYGAVAGAGLGAMAPGDENNLTQAFGGALALGSGAGFARHTALVLRAMTELAKVKGGVAEEATLNLYKSWLRDGGYGSGFFVRDMKDARQILQKTAEAGSLGKVVVPKLSQDPVHAILELAQILGEVTENATRFKTYKEGLEQGDTSLSAAAKSRDISLDFAQVGGNKYSAASRDIEVFFNAKVQSLRKMFNVMNPQTAKGRKAAMTALAALTAPSVGLWLINKDNEHYWGRPTWERNAYWLIPIGSGPDDFMRIPKPFEFGWIFASMPERILDYAYMVNKSGPMMEGLEGSQAKQSAKDFGKMFGFMNFAPLGPARIATEMATDFDLFRRTPINPEQYKNIPDALQYDDRTSNVAIGVSRLGGVAGFDWSPAKIDHALRSMTGSVGSGTIGLVDQAMRGTGLDPRGEKPASKANLGRAVLGRFTASGLSTSQREQSFMRAYKDAEARVNAVDLLEKSGNTAAATKMASKYEQDIRRKSAMDDVAKELEKVRRLRRSIYADRNLSAQEKRDALLRIRAATDQMFQQLGVF